jgi:hypothetical protein
VKERPLYVLADEVGGDEVAPSPKPAAKRQRSSAKAM